MTELWTNTQRHRLVRLCASITGDAGAAEDLAQETLVEAWRNRHKLRDASGADRWLSAIARNVCLRWQRRRGRQLRTTDVDVTTVADLSTDRSELEELVEGTLSILPPPVREVLVQHHVDEVPQAELALRLGVSEAAVSMRLSRGRRALRRAIEARATTGAGAWEPTSVWCAVCGRGRLEVLRDERRLAFRCPACSSTPGAVYDLANPAYAGAVGQRVRPTAMLGRLADWSTSYFRRGAGTVACSRCGEPVSLRQHRGERHGLSATCPRCGEAVWSSVTGLAHALPEARAFAREHRRVRTLGVRDELHEGTEATVVRLEAVSSTARLDVVFERDTLRRLAVR